LTSLNISEQYVDAASQQFNPVLLIDGGGNFVDHYNDVRDFLIKKSGLYDEIVILPHTIFGERQIEILNNISSDLFIFCRERVSVKLLEEGLIHGMVYLWHDCAFYNKFSQTSAGEGTLNAFRIDKESLLQTWPANIDISYNGYATKPLGEFIDTLQKFEQVNTDRLHVAIGATLLGKRVRLYSNSYYKNKAVFDYSLKRFSNVSFIENPDCRLYV
jgi:exopolysaccharide biosynthesis predicted pyruvyltransferase EpsI